MASDSLCTVQYLGNLPCIVLRTVPYATVRTPRLRRLAPPAQRSGLRHDDQPEPGVKIHHPTHLRPPPASRPVAPPLRRQRPSSLVLSNPARPSARSPVRASSDSRGLPAWSFLPPHSFPGRPTAVHSPVPWRGSSPTRPDPLSSTVCLCFPALDPSLQLALPPTPPFRPMCSVPPV